jgi:putative aldouronate transport system permease protein
MDDFNILTRIYIPLSMAGLATISLFYAVGHWNGFFSATIYINDMKKYPLQVFLRQLISVATSEVLDDSVIEVPPQTIRSAAMVITIFPILCVYPVLQKYFVKGVMIGSIKG